MGRILRMTPGRVDNEVHPYPMEQRYVRLGLAVSIGFHLLLLGLLAWAASIYDVRRLTDLPPSPPSPRPSDRVENVSLDLK